MPFKMLLFFYWLRLHSSIWWIKAWQAERSRLGKLSDQGLPSWAIKACQAERSRLAKLSNQGLPSWEIIPNWLYWAWPSEINLPLICPLGEKWVWFLEIHEEHSCPGSILGDRLQWEEHDTEGSAVSQWHVLIPCRQCEAETEQSSARYIT